MTNRWLGLGVIGLASVAGVAIAWVLYQTVTNVGTGPVPTSTSTTGPSQALGRPRTNGQRTSDTSRFSPAPATASKPATGAATAPTARADARVQNDAAAPAQTPAAASINQPAGSPVAIATLPVADPSTVASATVTPLASASSPKPDPLTIVVKKDAVIGIRLDQTITTETARVDEKITARVSRDVVVDGVTAIPAGTRLEGVVTLVDRGPRGGRGKLGIRFNTLVRADKTRVAIHTDTIFREGEPAGEPPAAIGASAALGAMVGNRSRPLFASSATGAPTAVAPIHRDAQLPAGSLLTVQLTASLSVSIERDPQ